MALDIKEDIAHQDRNREFYVRNVEAEMKRTGTIVSHAQSGKAQAAGRDLVKKLLRAEPYYRDQLVQSVAKQKALTDGTSPTTAATTSTVLDPYAKLMASRTDERNLLVPPDDPSIMALFLSGVDESVTEPDLREFYERFGEIKTITVIHRSRCAFVNFASRSAAEKAAEFSHYDSTIGGKKLKVQWARKKASDAVARPTTKKGDAALASGPLLGDDASASVRTTLPLPPPGQATVAYPSQQQRNEV